MYLKVKVEVVLCFDDELDDDEGNRGAEVVECGVK